MSRKNGFWSGLLILIGWVSLALPASAQHFQQVKGTLASVSAGGNEVFGIDSKGAPWRYNATSKSFAKIKELTGLVQIAVGGGTLSQLDDVWAVAAGGEVYRFNYSTKTFDQIPGAFLSQITVGEGTRDSCHPYEVWGITGSSFIYRYNYCTNQFDNIGGSLTQVATGGGDLWGINGNDQIYYYNFYAQAFLQVTGTMQQISVGVNDVWGINEWVLFRYDPNSFEWISFGGTVDQVAIGGDGVWIIAPPEAIYHYDSGGDTYSFDQVAGALKNIAVGSGAGVWGVNDSDEVFTFVRP
jgi:hypothetical protein